MAARNFLQPNKTKIYTDAIQLKDHEINKFSANIDLIENSDQVLATQKAIRSYIGQSGTGGTIHAVNPLVLDNNNLSIFNADANQSGVITTGTQSFSGTKTFLACPRSTMAPANATDLTNKAYVDDIAKGMSWLEPVIEFRDMAGNPPVNPQNGDRYIATITSGIFTENRIYVYDAVEQNWDELVPSEGDTLYVTGDSGPNANSHVNFNGTQWINMGSSILHQSLIGSGTLTHGMIDGFLNQDVRTTASPTFTTSLVDYGSGFYSFQSSGGINASLRREHVFGAEYLSDTNHPSIVSLYRGSASGTVNNGGIMRWRHAAMVTEGGDHSPSLFGLYIDVVSGNSLEGTPPNTFYGLNQRSVELFNVGGWQDTYRPGIIALPSLGVQNSTISESDRLSKAFLSIKSGDTTSVQNAIITYYQDVNSNGNAYIRFGNTRESTSSISGSVVIDGGLGVGSRLNAAGAIKTESNAESTSTTSGSIIAAGGLGVALKANIGGDTKIYSTTASTSTSTGALVIDGGLGVGENVNASGRVTANYMTCSNAPVNNTDVVRLGDVSGFVPIPRITLINHGFASPSAIPSGTNNPIFIDKVANTVTISSKGNSVQTTSDSLILNDASGNAFMLSSGYEPVSEIVGIIVGIVVNNTTLMFKRLEVERYTRNLIISKSISGETPHWSSGDTILIKPWTITYNSVIV